MPKKTREISSGLIKKGFKERMSGDKYYHYYNLRGEKTIIFTKMSHSKREYDDIFLGLMAKQLKIDKKFLHGLFDCPKSQEDYERHLRKINAIE